jgi:hypothetical protein
LGDAVIESNPGPPAKAGAAPLTLRIAKSWRGALEPWRPGVLRVHPMDPEITPEMCTWTVDPEGRVRSFTLGERGTFERVTR